MKEIGMVLVTISLAGLFILTMKLEKQLEIKDMQIEYYKGLKPPECNCHSSNLIEQPIKIFGPPVDSLCQVTWRIGYFTHEENCNNHE